MSVDRGDCQTMVGMTYEKHGFQAWSQQEAQLLQKDRAMLYVIEYFAKSLNVIESSRRPGLRSADTSNVALELNLVNVASFTQVQLPGILYLTKFTIDTNRFKNLLKTHIFRVLTLFVFVSRAL